jgi:hypothetical protein
MWGSWPDIYYCLTVTVLFLWEALSDERTGLSFVYAAGPRQRSLSWVRVPWISRPYFTVSGMRLLPIASYDSQGQGGGIRLRLRLHTGFWFQRQSQSYIATGGQSVSLGVELHYSLTVTVFFLWGALSDERTGMSFVYAAGPRQRSLSRVRVP